MRELILIAHNLRSCHNVGSLLRTAEGLGVTSVYLTGYTPYPQTTDDERLPHIATKITKQIEKTALGAEKQITWHHTNDVFDVLDQLKSDGFQIHALEQSEHAVSLPELQSPNKLALLVGREVEGVEAEVLAACSGVVEIPMFGQKESFNVVQAAAMALYHCRFI